jgi:hypothetical protein
LIKSKTKKMNTAYIKYTSKRKYWRIRAEEELSICCQTMHVNRILYKGSSISPVADEAVNNVLKTTAIILNVHAQLHARHKLLHCNVNVINNNLNNR